MDHKCHKLHPEHNCLICPNQFNAVVKLNSIQCLVNWCTKKTNAQFFVHLKCKRKIFATVAWIFTCCWWWVFRQRAVIFLYGCTYNEKINIFVWLCFQWEYYYFCSVVLTMGQDVYPVNMTRAVKRRITHPSWQRFEGAWNILWSNIFSFPFENENTWDIWWQDGGRYRKEIVAFPPDCSEGGVLWGASRESGVISLTLPRWK